MGITTDANGYEIDLRERGLRVCDWCKLVMSEGYMEFSGGGYACSQTCLAADPGWVTDPDEHTTALGLPVLVNDKGWEHVHITNDLIGRWIDAEMNDGPECHIFWTDWEGDESSEDAVERLIQAPYSFTVGDLHAQGAHDDEHFGPDPACNQCPQLDQWAVRK
jgi:hypothetical protein